MTEPRLVLKIKKALQAEGHYVAKIHGGRYSVGVPDLLIAALHVDGGGAMFVALEVKLPGKEKNVTELQAKNLRALRDAGAVAFVVSSVEAAIEVCRELPIAHAGMNLIYECD
jgi:hypothetical protein